MSNKIEKISLTEKILKFAPSWLTILTWIIVLSLFLVLIKQSKNVFWDIISYSLAILTYGFFGLHLISLLNPFLPTFPSEKDNKFKRIIRVSILIFIFFCLGYLIMTIAEMLANITSTN